MESIFTFVSGLSGMFNSNNFVNYFWQNAYLKPLMISGVEFFILIFLLFVIAIALVLLTYFRVSRNAKAQFDAEKHRVENSLKQEFEQEKNRIVSETEKLLKDEFNAEISKIKGECEQTVFDEREKFSEREQELIEKNEEAQQLSKRKSAFLAGMSHEIRTPLNGIIGMADVLLEVKLEPHIREQVKIIRKSGDLLLSLINDILDFSKIEAGKMVIEEIPFSLREEIDFLIRTFAIKAKDKKIRLSQNIHKNVPDRLLGDPFRLRQVFTNLVGNSLKFTHQGEILISAELIRDTFGTVILLFSVEDTGIGISKEKLSSIFDVYAQEDETVTRKYGGTGLGTSISKQLVDLMEGEIWVESPGTLSKDPQFPGSRFSFTAELFNDQRSEKEFDFSLVSNLASFKVLIAGNGNCANSILCKNLQKTGLRVDFVDEPKNLIKIAKADFIAKDRYNVIFIEDAIDFDGFNIVREFNKWNLTERYVVVLISANDKVGNYATSRRLGVDYYLVKPYSPEVILNILKENFVNVNFIEGGNDLKKESLPKELIILVAEDNLISQKVAQIIFKTLGYEIDIAVNGSKAVNMAAEKPYDIIFMDFIMPEKDGLQATKEIRAKGIDIPIVAMTANASEEDKNCALESGMNDFISKPVLVSNIKTVLMKWCVSKSNS